MTKRDLAIRIAGETNLTQQEVADVVQRTLDHMGDELAAGGNIEFRDFGVFEIKVRKSRKGRNPNKPENEVVIPQRVVVKFRAGGVLKKRVANLPQK